MLIQPTKNQGIKQQLMKKSKHFYGIVGGMGTAAGILFQEKFFDLCTQKGISGDQNYPEWVYINASKAPDRTKAIKQEGESPASYLIQVMKKMQVIGVEAVVVTCNTAHHFYQEVYEVIPIPWVHLQKETAKKIKQQGYASVGVFATEGTMRAQLYRRALESQGLKAIEPAVESELQSQIMDSIYNHQYGIKYTGNTVSSKAKELLYHAINQMNVSVVIAGCTELSVAFAQMEMPVKWFDPLFVAAEVLFDLCYEQIPLSEL